MFHSKLLQHVPAPFSNGLLTNNSTWCQNRGCICISSVRRTYGQIDAVSCIHPSTLNEQILQDRISKEEEREDPRRELQSSFQLKSKSVSIVSTHNPAFLQELQVFPHVLQSSTLILHTELILLQEISKKYYNYKAHPMHRDRRHPPTSAPHASKHSTWQNKAPGSPTAFQAHTAQAGFQLILPGRNSILSSSQHPRSPYSSSQANSIGIHLVLQNSTRRNKDSFQKGQVLYVHAILRSVCSKLLILVLRIILQEY